MSEAENTPVTINLTNINEGAATEAFAVELRKVLDNIGDMNTSPTATRSITLKFDFKPESDRCRVHTEFSIKAALAGVEKHRAKMFVGKSSDGTMVALDADPRQMSLWQAPKKPETPVIEFKTSAS